MGYGYLNIFPAAAITLATLVSPATVQAACAEGTPAQQKQCAAREAQQRAERDAAKRAQEESRQHEEQVLRQRLELGAQERSAQEALTREALKRDERVQLESHERSELDDRSHAGPHVPEVNREAQGSSRAPAEPAPRVAVPASHVPLSGSPPRPFGVTGPAHTGGAWLPSAVAGGPDISRPRVFPLNAATKVFARPGSRLLSIQRTNPDGSRLSASRAYVRGRAVLLRAFLSRRRADGALERRYVDGRRVIVGRDFVTRVTPSGITYTTHPGSMLGDATAASGRPIYRDRMETRSNGPTQQKYVVRTVYARVRGGVPTFLPTPVSIEYVVITSFGMTVLAYHPTALPTAFISPFSLGFSKPAVVGRHCYLCPAPVVVWQAPVLVYGDPITLVSDLSISTAVEDGIAEEPPAYESPPPPADDPELADLRAQVANLQLQLDAAARANDALRAELTELETLSETQPSPPAPAVMMVPEDVRQQVRDEVRGNLALRQQQKPLTWQDIVAAGAAARYVFQVSETIDATDDGGGECALTAGDLLRLANGAAARADVLNLEVVTSKVGSCAAGTPVSVGLRDAQQMLNDFNVRQDAIMQQLRPSLVSPGAG